MQPLQQAINILGTQAKLGAAINSPQPTVAMWLARKSVPPEYCADIERATGGKVTRKDLRPNDWQRIWPELADQSSANQVA
jgi:DNA-binding transcriptional regulator YdaS (Cro superfamily)